MEKKLCVLHYVYIIPVYIANYIINIEITSLGKCRKHQDIIYEWLLDDYAYYYCDKPKCAKVNSNEVHSFINTDVRIGYSKVICPSL